MAQTTTADKDKGPLRQFIGEEIKVAAPWEGVWPAKLANTILPPFIVLLRLTIGWVFAYSGFDKLIRGFSAEGFLVNATKGPLGGWFQSLGENQAALNVIEPLVVWGEILIGVALIFGVLTRWAALWGAVMMFMFYLAQFPPAHNPFMDYYLIYILVLSVLAALGAGRILGLDSAIERLPLVRRVPGASFFLG